MNKECYDCLFCIHECGAYYCTVETPEEAFEEVYQDGYSIQWLHQNAVLMANQPFELEGCWCNKFASAKGA